MGSHILRANLGVSSRFSYFWTTEQTVGSGTPWGLPSDFSQVTAHFRGSRLCFDGGVAHGVGGPNGFTRF